MKKKYPAPPLEIPLIPLGTSPPRNSAPPLIELQRIGPTYIIPFLPKGSDLEKDCHQIFSCVPEHPFAAKRSADGIFSGFTISDCPEYFELQLPRVYQPGSYLSHLSLILVFYWESSITSGTIVFAFDPIEETLYHIVTKKEFERYPFGFIDSYASDGHTLYFVGGCYRDHDVNKSYLDAFSSLNCVRGLTYETTAEIARMIAGAQNKMNLEVESFNMDRGKWVNKTNATKFNKPKHQPFVFTFHRKIYALAAKESYYDLGASFPSFEVLDTAMEEERRRGSPKEEDVSSGSPMEEKSSSGSLKEESGSAFAVEEKTSSGSLEESSSSSSGSFEEESRSGSPTTWSLLSPPPFLAVEDTRYILCKEKKCLFVKVSDDDVEGNIPLIWKFDLVSEKWYSNTTDTSNSFYDPEDSKFLVSLTGVPAKHFEGCIIDNILFYFEECEKFGGERLLVGHDLRGKRVIPRNWEIDLTHLLRGEGLKTFSCIRLCHIDDFKFCLVINYRPSFDWNVNFLCICMFELSLYDQECVEAMTQDRYDLAFTPTLLRRLYFQLPNSVVLSYHTKLEDRHDSCIYRRTSE